MPIKKPSLNQVLVIQGLLLALLLAFALYQVLILNLFPWLNLSIVFATSFLCLIFNLIINIQTRIIKRLILFVSIFQFILSSFLLYQPELLRSNWQWLFFPLSIIFCSIFWDLFSRRSQQIRLIGRIGCFMLLISCTLKFVNQFSWIEYPLTILIVLISTLLFFSKNNQTASF